MLGFGARILTSHHKYAHGLQTTVNIETRPAQANDSALGYWLLVDSEPLFVTLS